MRVVLMLVVATFLVGCGGSGGTAATPTPQPPVATQEPAMETPEPVAPTVRPLPNPGSFVTLTKRAWQKVVKNPDASAGSGYKVWACITQFDAATGADSFRGDASYRKEKYWFNGDNSLFAGDAAQLSDYVQGDIVSMSVVNLGSFSYDTQIGGNTTVPLFRVVKIHREKGSCD